MEDIKDNNVEEKETSETETTENVDSKEETKEASKPTSKEEKKAAKKKSKEEIHIEKLQAEVEKLKAENAHDRETYLKARADLENVRRRVQEEAIQDRKYASMNLVSDLIQPVDMLLKASNMETEDAQMKNFLIGFQMLANQIAEVLKRDGLSEIDSLNKDFDPNIHQAISKEHVEGTPEGKVIEVLQTGYKYKDRIIKPSMVKVSE